MSGYFRLGQVISG